MSVVELSSKAKLLKLGTYRHYKGNNYRVLGVVVHSESLEELVLYKAIYGKRLLWVRPLSMFLEKVTVGGKIKPRFEFISKAIGKAR